MTDEIRELQETFHSKLPKVKSFIYFRAGTNEDLQQEAMLAIWTGLLKEPNATDGYLRTRIRWRVRDVAIAGSSIDKPHTKREDVEFIDSNHAGIDDNLALEYIVNRYQPLDEQVIDKVDTERFLNTLDADEQSLVQYKLEGMNNRDAIRELHVSYERYYDIKSGLRRKIAEHFSA